MAVPPFSESKLNPEPRWYKRAPYESPRPNETSQKYLIPTLPVADQVIVRKHLGYRFELQKLWDLREFLINEIETKKMDKIKWRSCYQNSITEYYSGKFLFWGRKYNSTDDIFYNTFRSVLEDLMYRELSAETSDPHHKFNPTHIYYGGGDEGYREDMRIAASFSPEIWSLDERYEMTPYDISVMHRFRATTFTLFQKYLDILAPYAREKGSHFQEASKTIEKELRRITRVMVDPLNPEDLLRKKGAKAKTGPNLATQERRLSGPPRPILRIIPS